MNRFAKPYLTWFKKEDSIFWFDYLSDEDSIIESLRAKLI